MSYFVKDKQYYKFCTYGFLKNLRFYDAFLLLFFLENGISYSQIGLLYAVREFTIIFSEVPTGIIADTYGRKKSLIVSFLAYIISFLVFYYSKNFSVLIIAIVLNGIGDAFRSGTHKGMIFDYLKLNHWESHKINYYGHTRSWSQKGSAISALFAGFLVLYSGSYRVIFLFSIIPYLLNFINVFTYPNTLNFSLEEKEAHEQKSFAAVFKRFFSVIKKRNVFQIINSSALHSAFLKAIKDYIQPVMVQIAMLLPLLKTLEPKRKSGLVIGVIYFFIFLLASFASRLAFKISSLSVKNIPNVTLIVGLAAGVLCGLFINNAFWVLALVSFISIYMIENARKPILTAMIADQVSTKIITSVLSAQSLYSTFVTSILALLIGIIADNYGVGIALTSVSVLLILITVFVYNFKRD